MKWTALALALVCACTFNPARALTHIEFVTVGATEPTDLFWVPRAFRMGKYEVTNAQYAAFLNAVGESTTTQDTLYNASMGTSPDGGIARDTEPDGGFVYTPRPNMADKPVNFVSGFNAMRFCNWLHHGQPAGAAAASLIRQGAYDLTTDAGLPGGREPGARFALPTHAEWTKAGYYDPANPATGSDGFYIFPTRSNSAPVKALATATGGVSNPGSAMVNYGNGAVWGGQTGNLTAVGACGAPGPWGTFDQGGNLEEWTEGYSIIKVYACGGHFASSGLSLALQSKPAPIQFDTEDAFHGFRVVMPLPFTEPDMVEIGSVGNAADPISGLGAVSASYRIGRYEILNEEWVTFLNAQDDTGAYSLWHPDMGSTAQGGILRSGSASTGFVYWVRPGRGRLPVTHVSAVDAMRFCNWLHHGQPVRGVDAETIVGGAYDASAANAAATRLSGARYFLPTPSEWTKAARYDPVNAAADTNGSPDYWLYATHSDDPPPAARRPPPAAIRMVFSFTKTSPPPTTPGPPTGTAPPAGTSPSPAALDPPASARGAARTWREMPANSARETAAPSSACWAAATPPPSSTSAAPSILPAPTATRAASASPPALSPPPGPPPCPCAALPITPPPPATLRAISPSASPKSPTANTPPFSTPWPPPPIPTASTTPSWAAMPAAASTKSSSR